MYDLEMCYPPASDSGGRSSAFIGRLADSDGYEANTRRANVPRRKLTRCSGVISGPSSLGRSRPMPARAAPRPVARDDWPRALARVRPFGMVMRIEF